MVSTTQKQDCGHPWTITAPWFHWDKAGVPSSGRGTAPSIQKFASDNFINEFLKDAQRRVAFDGDDQIYTVSLIAANPGQFVNKLAGLFPLKADKTPWKRGDSFANLMKAQLVGTGVRKLFLPSHGRHYLIVCELHCDIAGFPAVPDKEVCQAGFVVRRRRLDYPVESRPEALALLRELMAAQAKLGDFDQTTPLRPNAAKKRASRIAEMKSKGTFVAERDKSVRLVTEKRNALAVWQQENGVRAFKEGWVSSEHDGIGSWQEVEDTPEILLEAWFPLHRLHADISNPAHDAHGRAMYYAVIPTSAFQVTAKGEARFDDRSTYEISCFFRRHDCHCPRKGLNVESPDCDGSLIWSHTTEQYRLAPHFDLVGTANRPVTIQMPDLSELAAQVAARPLGKYSPVRFIQPQSLQPETKDKSLTGGNMGGESICFFAIPLITIIALFVLNLFLPLVVFIFNLWFLLALKFCIPPSIQLDGALQAELDLIPPKLNVDAAFEVDVDASSFESFINHWNAGTLHGKLAGDLSEKIANLISQDKDKIRSSLDEYSNAPLVTLGQAYDTASKKTAGKDAGGGLDLIGGLHYIPHRLSQWKHEKFLPTTGEYL
ncbi:hypothetical protein [Methyloglobulus sp.]|uniref:hypothetical protein n=1 Tax=Methyloglobulus sp. TaxID=2518622 RepID=UPI0032B85DAD